MVKKKYKSKRVTLRLKYGIQKKVKAHKKKLSKLAKKHPSLVGVQRKKKDPGIPNLWPYKEELIEKARKQHEQVLEEKKTEKEKRKASLTKNSIESRQKAFEEAEKKRQQQQQQQPQLSLNTKDSQRRRWYLKELRKVIETSDVILEVLDARDPIGCRCPSIEKLIIGKLSEKAARPKRIVLVLNKIDLIPSDVLADWIKYLRREYPTIAFKSSTQQQGKLSQSDANATTASSGQTSRSTCIGGNALLTLLKQYCLSLNLKTAITVGVIGYPNVGKSSLVNSLKRSRAAGVGANPGFTKAVQLIKLDSNINLLDSPGVLFSPEDDEADLVLRNCLKLEQAEDPSEAVNRILQRCAQERLMEFYNIGQFTTCDEFVYQVALKRSKLVKGGVPDMKAAARLVLRDWTQGKIPYFTAPPEVKEDEQSAKIVTEWGKEFDIDKLIEESNTTAISSLKPNSDKYLRMQPSKPLNVDLGNLSDQEMDQDENEPSVEDAITETSDGEVGSDDAKIDMESEQPSFQITRNDQSNGKAALKNQNQKEEFGPQLNRDLKRLQKKQKKEQRREGRRAMDEEVEPTTTGDRYDFAVDWKDE